MSSVSGSQSGDSSCKRARDDSEVPTGVDESLQAKIARKEARVIRNRESAQRSRNQRKLHLADMEVRVRQLEEENRRLRGEVDTTTPLLAPSELRHSTPEQTVLNLAGELGIPPAMVSSGVNLSSVAPPPSSVAVKQEPATSVPSSELDRLLSENKALSERVAILENVLKQVVAVSNFSGFNSAPAPPVETVSLPPASTTDTFDFNSFLQPTTEVETSSTTTYPSSTMSTSPWSDNNDTTLIHPVACHSAAVATSVLPSTSKGEAQQRARGTESILHPSLITKERLDKVARIVLASAKLKGWTSSACLSMTRRTRDMRRRPLRRRRITGGNWTLGTRG